MHDIAEIRNGGIWQSVKLVCYGSIFDRASGFPPSKKETTFVVVFSLCNILDVFMCLGAQSENFEIQSIWKRNFICRQFIYLCAVCLQITIRMDSRSIALRVRHALFGGFACKTPFVLFFFSSQYERHGGFACKTPFAVFFFWSQ